MDKLYDSSDKAVADIQDGAVIMSGGFGLSGIPENLIRALVRKGVKNLTIIGNNLGSIDLKQGGAYGVALLAKNKQIGKFIGSFPGPVTKLDWFVEQYRNGDIEIEIMPQGTLNERIRCAGAGLGGVLTPTGIGTVFEEGKEKIIERTTGKVEEKVNENEVAVGVGNTMTVGKKEQVEFAVMGGGIT